MASSEWKSPHSLLTIPYLLFAPSILRFRRHVARRVDAKPAGGGKPLLRQEAALVVHLLGALDPVAEIDVRQSLPPGARDMVEDHVGAERAANFGRIEEGIDHRQPVAEHISQSHGQQLIAAAADAAVDAPPAILDDAGLDMAVLDHHCV